MRLNEYRPRLVALATSALLMATASYAADTQPDPALAKSWEYMQKDMPGVPYDVLKSACQEGSLTLYHGTWTEAEVTRVKYFQERFPCITVKRLEMVTASLRDRFVGEFRANRPTADIVQDTEQGALDDEADKGMLMKYQISHDADYPDAMKRSSYWYPLRVGLIGVAWNTTVVTPEEEPLLKDWKGLLNPVFKGRIGLVDANAINILPFYAFRKVYGDDFLKQLGTQDAHIYPSANPGAAALASGDIGVLVATETGVTPLYDKGAPIKWSFPEPSLAITTGQGIPANAPHPNAAKLYQEYSFTLEGYTYWQKTGGAPSRTNYTDQRKVAKESWYKYPTKFFEFTPSDFTKNAQDTRKLFTETVGSSH